MAVNASDKKKLLDLLLVDEHRLQANLEFIEQIEKAVTKPLQQQLQINPLNLSSASLLNLIIQYLKENHLETYSNSAVNFISHVSEILDNRFNFKFGKLDLRSPVLYLAYREFFKNNPNPDQKSKALIVKCLQAREFLKIQTILEQVQIIDSSNFNLVLELCLKKLQSSYADEIAEIFKKDPCGAAFLTESVKQKASDARESKSRAEAETLTAQQQYTAVLPQAQNLGNARSTNSAPSLDSSVPSAVPNTATQARQNSREASTDSSEPNKSTVRI